MGQIRMLSDVLASQVAAGEVVERPASVVKELLENSIDAGARRIDIEFQRGGTRLIRVTDDGKGMDRSDALLCLERHATSKIRQSADLAAIHTLGFRGEALPSIASISRFRISTRQSGEETGTSVEVVGGKIVEVKESGGAPGTQIEVADLFFNVPARRKFLRGEQTEASHLLQQIEVLAVAHPEIAFSCRKDEREVLRLAATEDLAVRLRDLHGEEFLRKLIPVPTLEDQGVRVHGWIARPGEGRTDRTFQMLFVNGRMIRSPILSLPLREACDGVLAKGLHPPAVLFFLVDPSAVDCNVHPAKREVRFRDPALVRSVAFQAAKLAWKEASPYSGLERFGEISNTVSSSWIASARSYQGEFESQGSNLTAPIQEASSSAFIAPPSSFSLNCPRYLGLLSDRYLLFEDQESLLMVEIRGARERILYERYLKQLGSGDLESQRLLLPEVLEMSPAELLWIDAHRSLLHKAGLVAESFGTGSLKIDAIPADAVALPILDILVRLVDELRTCEDSTSLDQKAKEAIASSVGHLAAVGAHMPAGEEAAQLLLRELLSCDLPYSTPKGRPTMSQLGSRELVRRFTA